MQINQRQLIFLLSLCAFAVENAQCDILGTTAYRPRRIVGGACVVVAVLGKYSIYWITKYTKMLLNQICVQCT